MYFSDGGHERKQFGLIAHGLIIFAKKTLVAVSSALDASRARP